MHWRYSSQLAADKLRCTGCGSLFSEEFMPGHLLPYLHKMQKGDEAAKQEDENQMDTKEPDPNAAGTDEHEAARKELERLQALVESLEEY